MAFLSPSETLAIAAKAKALKAAGENVCAMGAGEPDFDTPAHIKQAAVDALMKGETKYTPASGIPALKKAIAEKFLNDNGIKVEPSQVIVSPGAKFSGFAAICTLCGPGDEVIVPAPYWVSYTEMIKAAGATAVIVKCRAENNYELEPEQLQAAITPRTKLLILNSPSNPTGAVYRVSTIEKIAEIALKNNIMVMSDEIYEKLVYDPEFRHKSIASVSPEMNELTITINGFSKAYSMPGWRLGYLAFYLFFDVSSFGLNSTDFVNRLLEEEKVAGVPGKAFGDDHSLRVSYACSEETIREAAARIARFCEKLSR